MKNVLMIAVLCSFTLVLSAQDQEKPGFNTKKYEINIGVADIFVKNSWWYDLYYDEYGDFYYFYPGGEYFRQPALIMGFKYHGNKGALRVGLNFRYSQTEHKGDTPPDEKYFYQNMGAGINMGYEWHKTFGRVNVFYGLDGIYSNTNYKMKWETTEGEYESSDEYTINENRFGISPLLGVNFFITPALSVGTEVKFIGEYHKATYTDKHYSNYPYNSTDAEYKDERTGFRMYFGPLGFLSLNIHL
jgi:hypothetical protein